MQLRAAITALILGLNTGVVLAQQSAQSTAGRAEVPPPPPMVESEIVPDGATPDVRIVEKEDGSVHEYRLNGRLYAIKVVPSVGKPYFLVDSNGDGDFDTRRREIGGGLLIPSWVLLRW
jgi:hypothetical protein